MKSLFGLLFLFLVALLIIVCVSFLLPEASRSTSQVHPEYSSMLKSSGNTASLSSTLWLGYVYGVIMFAVMAVSILIGIQKREKLGTLGKWMAAGFFMYLLVFTALVYTYSQYTHDKHQDFFGGFLLPTAWMIYGMWLFPLFFVFLFTLHFDRWIMTKDDLRQFQLLLSKYRNHSGEND